MRTLELTEIADDRPTVLLLNGGGQAPYNKFHKATKIFKPFDCNIISVELPGHGKSAFNKVVNSEEMLEKFYHDFVEICNNYHQVGLFGFSLGALLSLKALEQNIYPFQFVIATGAGLKITTAEEDVMQKYASLEFFETMRWLPIMKKYHKDGWRYLLDSLAPMLRVGSGLFVSSETFEPETPLHLIVGDQDGVVDHSLQKPFTSDKHIYLHVVENTAHFDYFTRSWDTFRETLTSIVDQYLA